MTIAKRVRQKIESIEAGRIVTYQVFSAVADGNMAALAKVLQQEVARGVLVRPKKGHFYKPRKTLFGVARPSEEEVLKLFLQKNGEYTGYVSGQDVFLKFKMSTQVANSITIATKKISKKKTINGITIHYICSYVEKCKSYEMEKLQLLDCIRLMKKAMDTSPDIIVGYVLQVIQAWTSVELRQLYNLACKYPPSTRAVLGALFENIGEMEFAHKLKKTLNPLTSYSIGVSKNILPQKASWRIR